MGFLLRQSIVYEMLIAPRLFSAESSFLKFTFSNIFLLMRSVHFFSLLFRSTPLVHIPLSLPLILLFITLYTSFPLTFLCGAHHTHHLNTYTHNTRRIYC